MGQFELSAERQNRASCGPRCWSPGPGPTSPEIDVTKGRGPSSMYPEPDDGRLDGEGTGPLCKPGKTPVHATIHRKIEIKLF